MTSDLSSRQGSNDVSSSPSSSYSILYAHARASNAASVPGNPHPPAPKKHAVAARVVAVHVGLCWTYNPSAHRHVYINTHIDAKMTCITNYKYDICSYIWYICGVCFTQCIYHRTSENEKNENDPNENAHADSTARAGALSRCRRGRAATKAHTRRARRRRVAVIARVVEHTRYDAHARGARKRARRERTSPYRCVAQLGARARRPRERLHTRRRAVTVGSTRRRGCVMIRASARRRNACARGSRRVTQSSRAWPRRLASIPRMRSS